MTSHHEPIVDFELPPVAEVGLGIQIRGATLDASHALGQFFPIMQDRYPTVVPQPPVPPMAETFEIPSQVTVAFQLLGGPEAQRWAFVSKDEHEMISVQPDRFAYNWSKDESEIEYPRYGSIRERFEEAYRAYLALAEGDVAVTWCEINYANPVLQEPGEPRPDLSTLVRRVTEQEFRGLPQPYNSSLEERFQLERDGEPYARFFVHVASTVGSNRRIGYTIQLVMRGKPPTPDIDGALQFFDEGRELIVTTFREMTTPARHAQWHLTK
jgi:uncharacterized protein (TIGR04255 family)